MDAGENRGAESEEKLESIKRRVGGKIVERGGSSS